MSGKFYFLDTNAIIQLLKGNQELVEILSSAEFIACSVISKLEYFSYSSLSKSDIKLFNVFSEKIEIIGLPSSNDELHEKIITLRQERRLKLPDAIIVGCSIYKKCTLITADKKILETNGLDVLLYQVI